MRIVQLKAENFRLFQQLSLPLSGRLNLFVGENAAGKTSILEMLYCLNRARSFRGTTAPELAGPELKQWTVFGAIEDESGARHSSGVQWTVERSEEHTSELQSLMRISYAVFCLKKKKQ